MQVLSLGQALDIPGLTEHVLLSAGVARGVVTLPGTAMALGWPRQVGGDVVTGPGEPWGRRRGDMGQITKPKRSSCQKASLLTCRAIHIEGEARSRTPGL